MKKGIVFGLIMLLLASFVSAVNVDCSEGRWNSDICREHELQDEFDEVTDSIDENTDDINKNTKTIKNTNKKVNKNKKAIKNLNGDVIDNDEDILLINNQINNNKETWSYDSSGISKREVLPFLFKEIVFINYFEEKYVTRSEFEDYKVNILAKMEVKIYDLYNRIYELEKVCK